jgi:cytochrome P450
VLETLSNPEDVAQTYAWFQQMRQTQPVWYDEERRCWHVFRYADMYPIMTNYQLYSSERKRSSVSDQTASLAEEEKPRREKTILTTDPPEHRRYRNLVSAAFTPRAIERMRDRVAAITQELLDEARQTGRMDFASAIAYPLPTMVIADLLGVPRSDLPQFKRWADGLLRLQLGDAEVFRWQEQLGTHPDADHLTRTFEEISNYFRLMLEERKRRPREDMMSLLLAAEVEGKHLSFAETISFCTVLLLAGHITTTNLFNQAIRCFDEHPRTLDLLRRQPELMPRAVEEVLRYASPIWRMVRTTTEAVKIADVDIPRDAIIFAWLASANRDAEQFVEPERFDVQRTPNRHLAFGHGIHFCIGAPLARLEAAVALPMILQQLPNLRVEHEVSLEFFEGQFLFGIKRLPIRFDVVA